MAGLALLPGYEHDIEPGAGLSVSAGAVKFVKHTTESRRGTYRAVRNLWRGPANWGKGLPHFLMDGPRIVQLLPLTVGAYTLVNDPGGADTNRSGPAIQLERCGFAADPMPDDEYDALGKLLADLVDAGHALDLAQHPRFYGANEGIVLARKDSPIRMSAREYEAFNGFCGHQHVPENDHWDPGKLDGDRLEAIARTHLAGGQPAPTPTPEDEDDDMVKAPRPCYRTPAGIYGVNAVGRLQLLGGPATDTALHTPNQGNPPELQPPLDVSEETLQTLLAFYNVA